jgi:hypothetical protein
MDDGAPELCRAHQVGTTELIQAALDPQIIFDL